MTMPQERMRSIRWGRELLESLKADSSVPPALVARAAQLAQTYPTTRALTLLLEADSKQLPDSIGDSIDDARALFEEILVAGHGNEQTRGDARFTLRHFPLQGATAHAADAALLGGLKNWLASEDPQP